MLKTLEHNEHAEHIAHSGAGGHAPAAEHAGTEAKNRLFSAQKAALLVAALAAGLAVSEQGAKHAEIKVQANLIDGADAWAQYQAKSTRSTLAKDLAALIGTLEPPSGAEMADRRKQVIESLKADQERYDNDPKDGREAIAHRAHEFEHARDHALEQTHAYHNGSAAMELGIVLATASAIIGSRLLIGLALGVGSVGAMCALAGYFKPEWGVF
jgi:hypothetical protein